MTENLTQAQVFSLIAQLNSFADQAEKLIQQANSANTQAQQALESRHKQALAQLKRNYENTCRDIVSHGDSTIREAREILTDVQAMDARLTNADKYYKKTKKKKEDELNGVTSDQFDSSTDYFFMMGEIRHSYQMISERYVRDMLPGIINGLNYLFSKKRKQDYEDLIILLNTLHVFVQEMESFLPDIISDSLKQQKDAYDAQLRSMKASQVREQDALTRSSNDSLTRVAQRI